MTTIQDIKAIKKLIIDTIKPSNAGHISSSFSCVEILYSIYKCININQNNISAQNRDRVIISKEHCRLAQVCILSFLGLLKEEYLKNYCLDNALLGHDMYNIVCDKIPAIDIASGSLGHGLSVGAGMALADKEHRVFVLCGDGELQEGSIYEAMLFIIQHNIKNITLVIDQNRMQIDNYTKNILDTSNNLIVKLSAMGFDIVECDGHNVEELQKAILKTTLKPKCIIANTTKGNGIQFLLEKFNFAKFHHSGLNDIEFNEVYEALKNE